MAPHLRRTWAPRGQTPVLTQRGRSRRKISVIAALTISPRRKQVRCHFGFLPDANYDGEAILAFVQALARTVRTPIELVWDRLQAHHRGPVGAWLDRHPRVRAHLLPGYAPELNPVELIWGHAKMNPLANFAPSELHELLKRTQQAARAIAHNQPLLRSFIKHGRLSLRLR
jgi:transposase